MDHIRAEGDFHKEIYSSKDQYDRNKTGKAVRKRTVVGRIYGTKSFERAIKTDRYKNRIKKKLKKGGQARLVHVLHKP